MDGQEVLRQMGHWSIMILHWTSHGSLIHVWGSAVIGYHICVCRDPSRLVASSCSFQPTYDAPTIYQLVTVPNIQFINIPSYFVITEIPTLTMDK